MPRKTTAYFHIIKYIPRLQCEWFYKVHVNYIQRRCEKMRIIKIDAGKTCQPFWCYTILKMFSGIWINQDGNWDGEIHNLFAMLLTKKQNVNITHFTVSRTWKFWKRKLYIICSIQPTIISF